MYDVYLVEYAELDLTLGYVYTIYYIGNVQSYVDIKKPDKKPEKIIK